MRIPLLIILLMPIYLLIGQVSIPYYNSFDLPNDTAGWSHYSLTGTDNWELGTPQSHTLNVPFTSPNAWKTNLSGDPAANSTMYLESPSFDLSSTSTQYVLSFMHSFQLSNKAACNIEYSLDNGIVWQTLYNYVSGTNTNYYNWYFSNSLTLLGGEAGWINNSSSSFHYELSSHVLDSLQGNSAVKFRFKLASGNITCCNHIDGWVIDNFSITENIPNVQGIQSTPATVTTNCTSFAIELDIIYTSTLLSSYNNTVKYYWSDDMTFDASDTLIGSKTQTIYGSNYGWSESFPLANVSAGDYYIFYEVDADSVISESNEIDNVGMATLTVDSVYAIPAFDNFDNGNSTWTEGGDMYWVFSPLDVHGYEGTHSGDGVWSIYDTDEYDVNYIESPNVDLSTHDSTLVSFWYRTQQGLGGSYNTTVQAFYGCGQSIYNQANIVSIYPMRNNTWDFITAYIPEEADTSNDVVIRIYNGNAYTLGGGGGNQGKDLVIDDVYIGAAKPDISIEGNLNNRYTMSTLSIDTLHYYVNNSGLATANSSSTYFYWSNDTILDGGDILLGVNTEPIIPDTSGLWSEFIYNKPSSVSGEYYVFYVLDSLDSIDEMREYNNKGYFTVFQQSLTSVPYFNDFETQINGWRHNSTVGSDVWEWEYPNASILNDSLNDTKCWNTNSTGNVDESSRMHLYTPLYDLSGMNSPVLSFSFFSSDYAHYGCNLSYSFDGGATWHVLDPVNNSFKGMHFYTEYSLYGSRDRVDYLNNTDQYLFGYIETSFTNQNQYHSRDSKNNTEFVVDVTHLKQYDQIQFRYNFSASPQWPMEGVLIDDFNISEAEVDLTVDNKKHLMLSSLTTELNFSMSIDNKGNYISTPAIIDIYLSNDNVLDNSDILVSQDSIPEIRPKKSYYYNARNTLPSSIVPYNYLIYELDPTQTNLEVNEVNNIGYWPLSLDSVQMYPYLETFNDTIINGWHEYAKDKNGNHITHRNRIRNMLAEGESVSLTGIVSGEMFSDQISGGMSLSQVPISFLESPSFNFVGYDSIYLGFDLMCTGRNAGWDTDGGNLEYSTDGGNNWTLLEDVNDDALGWYNSNTPLTELDYQDGWTNSALSLTPRGINISYLNGYESVIFRFKYSSNWQFFGQGFEQGFRMDNFTIETNDFDVCSFTSFDSIEVVQCNGNFTLPSGQIVNVSGMYNDTLVSSLGCDSVIVVDLHIEDAIYGIVTTSTQLPYANTKVYLIEHYTQNNALVAIDTTYTDVDGYYYFDNNSPNLYVKVIPDPLLNTNQMPSYFMNTVLWQSAQQITCSPTGNNFSSIAGNNPGGSGFVGGFISQGAGKNNAEGDPIEGLTVFLVNSNGEIVAFSVTNVDGYFSFDDIPCDDYQIWVDDVTTINSLSPLISISQLNCVKDSLHFVIEEQELKLVTPVSIKDNNELQIYMTIIPNPAKDEFTIQVNDWNGSYKIEVFTVLGELVYANTTNSGYTNMSADNWESGVYFVYLKDMNNIPFSVDKILINKN